MITKIFKELGWVEELGSGRKNIRKYAPIYFPEYQVVISNQEKFIFSITYQKPEADIINQSETRFDEGTKLAPSWDHVGTKPALSWDQVEELLTFLKTSKVMKELMEVFGWSDRTKFRDKYIRPMLESKLIEMSQPDKPKSPNQNYYLSDKGKTFLEHLSAQMSVVRKHT